jgi:hypothetical protein
MHEQQFVMLFLVSFFLNSTTIRAAERVNQSDSWFSLVRGSNKEQGIDTIVRNMGDYKVQNVYSYLFSFDKDTMAKEIQEKRPHTLLFYHLCCLPPDIFERQILRGCFGLSPEAVQAFLNKGVCDAYMHLTECLGDESNNILQRIDLSHRYCATSEQLAMLRNLTTPDTRTITPYQQKILRTISPELIVSLGIGDRSLEVEQTLTEIIACIARDLWLHVALMHTPHREQELDWETVLIHVIPPSLVVGMRFQLPKNPIFCNGLVIGSASSYLMQCCADAWWCRGELDNAITIRPVTNSMHNECMSRMRRTALRILPLTWIFFSLGVGVFNSSSLSSCISELFKYAAGYCRYTSLRAAYYAVTRGVRYVSEYKTISEICQEKQHSWCSIV